MTSPQEIKEIFKKTFEPFCEFGCLFGSVLTGSFNEESDVDVAVYTKKKDFESQLFRAKLDFAKQIDRNVDLIDLRTADPIIVMQIIENGVQSFPYDKDSYVQFKARKISEYLDFKMSRRLVEKELVTHRIIEKKT